MTEPELIASELMHLRELEPRAMWAMVDVIEARSAKMPGRVAGGEIRRSTMPWSGYAMSLTSS